MRAFLARIVERLPLKTLDRYIMKQFAISYGICTSSMLTFIIVIEGFSRLDKFLKEDASVLWVIATYFAANVGAGVTTDGGDVVDCGSIGIFDDVRGNAVDDDKNCLWRFCTAAGDGGRKAECQNAQNDTTNRIP